MSKVKKATKRFAQKQAKAGGGVAKPHKRRHGSRKGHAAGANGAAAKPPPSAEQQQQGKRVEDMGLDEFLDGGWELAAGSGSGSEDEAGDGGAAAPSDSLDGAEGGSGSSESEEQQRGAPGSDGGGSGSDAGASEDEGEAEGGEDDSDSDEPGAGGPEAAAVAADNKRLRGSVSRHKAQLEELRHKDPEFYQYLQDTDAGLLGFGEGEDDDEGEDESEEGSSSDEEQQQPASSKKAKQAAAAAAAAAAGQQHDGDASDDDDDEQQEQQEQKAGLQVTSALVDGWCAAALDKASLGSMMQLVKAYRVACHYGDSEQQMSSTLTITSGAVFNKVLLFMLREADGIFRRMLGLQPDASTAAAGGAGAGAPGSGGGSVLLAEQVPKAPRWRKVEPLAKSYLGNSLHLLASMTQPAMTAYTLRRLRASAAFLGPFPVLTRKLLRLALQLFGSEEPGPRLQALLLLRQLALVLPPPCCTNVLRGAYRAFVSHAKFVSPASLPLLGFMAAGVVELSSLDLAVTYQVGFVSIRELALLLRNALAAKTQDAHKEVYCWQTLQCLELWVKVLAAAAPRGTLAPLVYPLTQLLLGAARLVPTPRYFPIRLRLVRVLNKLSQATSTYVPVSPLLLEMLQWAELRKSPTGGTAAAPDMLLLLRLSKTQLKTAALQEEVVMQVLELLTEHLSQWATSVSYPELVHLPLVALRGFAKGCSVERFRRQAKQLVDALERNTAYVGAARDSVAFAPQDLAAAAAFLASDKERAKAPLVQFATQLLAKAASRMALRSKELQVVGAAEAATTAAGGSGSKRRHDEEGSSDAGEEQGEDDGGEDGGLAELMAREGASEDEEDEAQLGAAARRMLRQKEKRLKRSAKAAAAAGSGSGSDSDADEGAADQLADYQLSEDESDEQPAAGDGSSSEDEDAQRGGARRPAAGGRGKGGGRAERGKGGGRRGGKQPGGAGRQKQQHKASPGGGRGRKKR